MIVNASVNDLSDVVSLTCGPRIYSFYSVAQVMIPVLHDWKCGPQRLRNYTGSEP